MKEFTGFKKGINLGGWLSQCRLEKEHMEGFITEADFQKIKSMGADHVRLPIDYELIEREDATPIPEGYRYIDRCVELCAEYGLNMILDLHKTAGYVFDDAANCGEFFESEALQGRFLALWSKLAAHYGKYGFIAFDLLNEIVDDSVCEIWNTLAAKAISRIRSLAPRNWILVGGTNFNSISSVKGLLLPPDERIVYSFHFYEPMIFTHQGAEWVGGMDTAFRTSYPLTAQEYIELSDTRLNGCCADSCRQVPAQASGADMLLPLFEEALRVADERGVPLYCGEYGVINLAKPEYKLAYIRDLHSIFEKYEIGRAMWCCKGMDFGLTDSPCAPVFDELCALL
ncbi:MAG: glycoside hydrolase family 5 protein [Butyrivibrio sp.]|nr:glycoside hydrolase family 5 protein [Butyrivibrio sp.]